MKTFLPMLFTALLCSGLAHSQTTAAGWSFDFSGSNSSGAPYNSNVVITSVGTSGSAFYSSVGCAGGEAIANGWSVNDHWKSGAVNFTGFTNLTYSFKNWSFPNGPTGTFKFQYSLNNSTWVDIVSYNVNATSSCNANGNYSNQSLPAALNNQSSVYFRWINNGSAGSSGAGNRLDGVEFKGTVASSCTNPDVPTVTKASGTVCSGDPVSLSISGSLNDATTWRVYSGSCGGSLVGSTASSSITVNPTSTTTYYVRGEGGCVTPGSCGSVTVTVTNADNASFSYSSSAYCVDDSDPSPTITGLSGGSFSSTAGLAINSSGVIDVSASTPGTYSVTYTTTGTCPNSSSVNVTINALDDASFSYSSSAYCVDDSDPSPTITGLSGGSFSSTTGLAISSSGVIDVSASTPGTYTVTYTTAGTCPNSSNTSVTINALDNAGFSYSASSYCLYDSDPSPTITGLSGGSFSSTAGLAISSSGVIDVSASTPGTYTVTYTTAGVCPNSSTASITINAIDNAGFNYSASSYCVDASDPSPTITGLSGGSFSSTTGLAISSSGIIDVSASTPGTYTVTYTTAGVCPNSSTASVTIIALDNPNFSYSSHNYCPNDTDPTPNITGLSGGTFSSASGLSIIPSSGLIDLSASTPGTYNIIYTTNGSCPNTSSFTLFVGDTVKPVITPPSDQNELLGLNCLYTLPDYTSLVGVTDNCDPSPAIVQSPSPGTNLGVSTIINFTITDASGNSSTTSLNLNLGPIIHRDTILVYTGRDYTFPDGHVETGITDTLTHLSTLTSIQFSCDSLQSTFVKVISSPCHAKGRRNTFEWIQEVQIGNITNNTGRNSGGYGSYINQTVIAEQGDTLSVSLTPGYKRRAYDEAWRVWIDWNFDGDFADAGELAFQSLGKYTQTGEIIVPSGVEKGKLALRAFMSWKKYTTACSTGKNGEVEDYTIEVTDATGSYTITKQAQPTYDDIAYNSESIFEFAEYYPNPVLKGQDVFFVVRSALDETKAISVTNGLGQIIHTEIIEFKEGINEFTLDLETIQSGYYIISINGSNESTPLIVQ